LANNFSSKSSLLTVMTPSPDEPTQSASKRSLPRRVAKSSGKVAQQTKSPRPVEEALALPLEDAATALRFETPAAALLALAMFYGFSAGLTCLAMQAAHSTPEGLLTLLWPLAVGLQFIVVVSPSSSLEFARRWTFIMSVPIFLLPHLPVCKRGAGKAVGAAQGAAALVLIVRSFGMLHRMEEEEAGLPVVRGLFVCISAFVCISSASSD
jgi:hypothetical protein